MPMIDAYIHEHALAPEAEQTLLRQITDLVVRIEIGDATNQKAQNASWIFLHRPTVYVAGKPATAPRYRFVISVPEGQFDPARRQAVTEGITAAVAEAERLSVDEVKGRVWIITTEIPDGNWGAHGRVVRLPDILNSLLGEGGRHAALESLGKRAGW